MVKPKVPAKTLAEIMQRRTNMGPRLANRLAKIATQYATEQGRTQEMADFIQERSATTLVLMVKDIMRTMPDIELCKFFFYGKCR